MYYNFIHSSLYKYQQKQKEHNSVTSMKKQKDLMPKISAHVQFETVSPATKLLEKRRKMYEVHEAFEVQKQQHKKQQETFKAIQQDIRKRDLEIQIHLINFCQFLQENDSKRKKAVERFNQEKQVYTKKVEQIEKLEQQIRIGSLKEQKYDKRVKELGKYLEYLQKVKNSFVDQYPQVADILSRYHTLKKSNKKLFNQKRQMQEQKERLKKQSAAFERQISQQLLTLGNDIKDLSKRLQQRLNQKQELESQLQRSRDQYSKKNLDLYKIFTALNNLYEKCKESPIRVQHRFEQFKSEKQVKKGKKKAQPKKNKEKDESDKREQVQNNIQLNHEESIMKLKSIFAYTSDYKYILENYKKTTQK